MFGLNERNEQCTERVPDSVLQAEIFGLRHNSRTCAEKLKFFFL